MVFLDIERQLFLAGDEIILIFTGVLVCFLGYLIWIKQKLGLLAGYKERFIKDKKGLSSFMGKWLFTIGIITILIPLGVRAFNQYIWWLYASIILIAALRIYIKMPYYLDKK